MELPDLTQALKATEGDVDLLREVVEAFLEECPLRLIELKAAIESNDCVAVRRAGHTIAGNLRLFGDVPPCAYSRELEEMGRIGDLHGAQQVYQSLKTTLEDFGQQLSISMKALSA